MRTGISLRSSFFCNGVDCFEEFVFSRKYPLEKRVTFATLLPAADFITCARLNGLSDPRSLRSSVEIAIMYFG